MNLKVESRDSIVCSPLGIDREGGWTSVRWSISGLDRSKFELFHSVRESDESLIGSETRGDSVLAATLLVAMGQGRGLRVEGEVSPTLLDGFERLQSIWERWGKGRCRRIPITAERETEPPTPKDDGAIFCMSGGLDGAFSFFRHHRGEHGRINRQPKNALMIHGLDIPLSQSDCFANASDVVKRMISGTGANLITMRTNSRELPQDWEESHGLHLTACLLMMQSECRFGIIASGNTYDELNVWGSTPIADPLGSTAAMSIEHDGSEFNRAEKAGWLGRNTDVSDLIRVCWEGERGDSNCGRCEKCIRTMMNFWANGLQKPKSFPTELTLDSLKSLPIRDGLMIRNLRRNIVVARQHLSPEDKLLKAAEKLLFYAEMRQSFGETKRRSLAFIRSWF